ncbi:MAG: beta-hydroxyacyl-ACP dehydratase, partial [Comamonadaceae bacterium]|nr:beta-hydroxyacyl-ACP dehydratase [Comamonadaceae bacterium]
MKALPLATGVGLDHAIAWTVDGPRRVRDLIADARALDGHLPPCGYLLNVCQDRYRFAVGFTAGLLAGKVSLQPSSQSEETLRRVMAEHPDVVCLTDADFDSLDMPQVRFPALPEADPKAVEDIPLIPVDRLAAVLFTSGSTGLPQPHRKTWGKLVQNGRVEAMRLGLTERPH